MKNMTTDMFEIEIDSFVDECDYTLLEPVQALAKCIDECGFVDVERIAKLSGMYPRDLVTSLKGAIIRNPENWSGEYCANFELMDTYLSGNLSRKLRIAQSANKRFNGIFDENIAAINSVIPNVVNSRKIKPTLGAPWIPEYIIDDFIVHLLGNCKKHNWYTIFDPISSIWGIPYASLYRNNKRNSEMYGTPFMSALDILEATLNAKTIEIKKPAPSWEKKRDVIDHEKTALALEKQRMICEEFDRWIFSSKERTDEIYEAYDNTFGCIVTHHYKGHFLSLDGINPEIKLKEHQLSAIARIVFNPNTLIAHDVGTGKTFTMIAAGQELRRMGLSTKNMYVVPNSVLCQFEEQYRILYPHSRILTVDHRNFSKKKRRETLEDIRDTDYDAVLIAASTFSLVPLSKEHRLALLTEEREEIMRVLISDQHLMRKLAIKKVSLIDEEIKKLREEIAHDRLYSHTEEICFDHLGITTLFVDEAHEYKNITIKSRNKALRGVVRKGSAKADGMLAKVHFTQKHGRGVVFATATPISNSLADVYTMQIYLQRGELKFLNLHSFDSWTNTFAQREESLELDVDGCSLKTVSRLMRFCNLDLLSSLFSQVTDFYITPAEDQILDYETVDIKVTCSQELKDYIKELSQRAEAVRLGGVPPCEDNLLKITVEGSLAAVDLRILAGHSCNYTDTKTYRCAEKVFDIWEKTSEEKLTQIVFCDVSTPKKGFNVYNELRFRLLQMGVPMSDIAFIHDASTEAEKKRLFERMNRGSIRILVGSTQKLGTGVNCQRLLTAVHHIDVPWKPSDIVQRQGRMLRQGNECTHKTVYRYVTKNSFDAFSWQLLQRKQDFISQFMTNTLSSDVCESFEEMTLSFAEIKALAVGNPLIRRQIELQNELNRTLCLQRAFMTQRRSQLDELNELPSRIEKQKKHYKNLTLDSDIAKASVKLEGEARKEFAVRLSEALAENVMQASDRAFESFMGFEIILPCNMLAEEPRVILRGHEDYIVAMGNNIFGNVKRLENAIANLSSRAETAGEVLTEMNEAFATLSKETARKNPYEDRIANLRETLAELESSIKLTNI